MSDDITIEDNNNADDILNIKSKLSNRDRSDLIKSKKNNTIQNYRATYISNDEFFNKYHFDTTMLYKLIHSYKIKNDDEKNNENRNHYIGLHTNDKFFRTQFYLTNRFENTTYFTNKGELFFKLKKYYNKYYRSFIPDMFILNVNSKYEHGNIYIARIIQSWAGEGVFNISNEKEFNETKKELNKIPGNIVVSQYINNPLLFNGKKCHLRSYFMITIINNVFSTYLLDIGTIITASLPYKKGDYTNKKIHDTHYFSTGREILYPENFYDNTSIKTEEEWCKIYNKMSNALNFVSRLAIMSIELYPNAKNTFEIYGTDFLITDDHEVYLIEINNQHTSYKLVSSDKFYNEYFNWINDVVFKPAFAPDEPIPVNRSNTPVFTCKYK
jgi:hypothetical protein